jgi:hypothetical protein
MWRSLKHLTNRLLRTLRHDRKQDIVDLLGREYADKMKDPRKFRLHSEQMRYNHFRAKLQRLVDEEEKHAQWLRDRVVALGGEAPQVISEPEDARNTWEDLRLDLLEEKRHQWDLIDQLHDRAYRYRNRGDFATNPRGRKQSSDDNYRYADAQ